RLPDRVDHALGVVVVDEEVVTVDRVRDALSVELLLDVGQLLDRPVACVVPHHRDSQPRRGAGAIDAGRGSMPPMAGRPVAFVCAMPMELEPLTRALDLVETDVDGLAVHTGRIGDHDAVGIVTGMGTALATKGVERLLDAYDVDHLFVVGIAGAGTCDTPIGTLVMPEVVVHGPSGRE